MGPQDETTLASRPALARFDVITPDTPLVLGSASPRRHEILTGLGLPLVVIPAMAEEAPHHGESPAAYLGRVVDAKLAAVASRLVGRRCGAVLVADTIVVVGDEVLGKPASVAEAERLLAMLAGRTHTVLTRYGLAGPDRPAVPKVSRTVSSQVTMRSATHDEIARYARTGEGLDKAGGYAIQGIGSFLVKQIEGSCSNVVGLPACEVVLDLRDAGLLGAFP